VTEQIDRDPGIALLGDPDHIGDVRDIVGNVLDVEALALGLAPAAQVDGVHDEPLGGELLAGPDVLPAVRVQPVADGDDRAWRALRPPGPQVKPEAARPGEVFFGHRSPPSIASPMSVTPAGRNPTSPHGRD
jgi:hypothetical protein